MVTRDWERYARVLDLYLNSGWTLQQIADSLGISRERARQMVDAARWRLAYRVFKGVPRHHWTWDKDQGRWKRETW